MPRNSLFLRSMEYFVMHIDLRILIKIFIFALFVLSVVFKFNRYF